MAFLPTILYFVSAGLFIMTVVTNKIMYMLAGAIVMFAASILTKRMNSKK